MSAPRSLTWSTFGAALIAALIGVVVVAPAETGVDPLGSGAWLGIRRGTEVDVHQPMSGALHIDHVQFVLDPYESIEYKYRLEAGAPLVYAWTADDEVVFDFHGEIEGEPVEEGPSYQLGRAASSAGRFSATGGGLHGWYWQNRTFKTVTVTLHAAGFMYSATTYSRIGAVQKHFGPANADRETVSDSLH